MSESDTKQFRVTGVGAIYQKQAKVLGPDGNLKTISTPTLAGRGEVIDLGPFESDRLLSLDPPAVRPADEGLAYDEMSDDQLRQLVTQRGLEVRGTAADGTVRREDEINALTIHDQGFTANVDPSTDEVKDIANHVASSKLNIDDTVALAGDDPVVARRVLEAEKLASGGSPRAGVVSKLQKIIDGE